MSKGKEKTDNLIIGRTRIKIGPFQSISSLSNQHRVNLGKAFNMAVLTSCGHIHNFNSTIRVLHEAKAALLKSLLENFWVPAIYNKPSSPKCFWAPQEIKNNQRIQGLQFSISALCFCIFVNNPNLPLSLSACLPLVLFLDPT